MTNIIPDSSYSFEGREVSFSLNCKLFLIRFKVKWVLEVTSVVFGGEKIPDLILFSSYRLVCCCSDCHSNLGLNW